MNNLSQDPIQNAINDGIKEDIRVAFDNHRFRATIILIYAGMDVMAFLDMPEGQKTVSPADFIAWTNRYIKFPCQEQITGLDFWGARCGVLHEYGVESNSSRKGKCRLIGYSDKAIPEVRFHPEIHSSVVMVSIFALKEAFFRAIDDFLVAVFTNPEKAAVVEPRLQRLILVSEFNPS